MPSDAQFSFFMSWGHFSKQSATSLHPIWRLTCRICTCCVQSCSCPLQIGLCSRGFCLCSCPYKVYRNRPHRVKSSSDHPCIGPCSPAGHPGPCPCPPYHNHRLLVFISWDLPCTRRDSTVVVHAHVRSTATATTDFGPARFQQAFLLNAIGFTVTIRVRFQAVHIRIARISLGQDLRGMHHHPYSFQAHCNHTCQIQSFLYPQATIARAIRLHPYQYRLLPQPHLPGNTLSERMSLQNPAYHHCQYISIGYATTTCMGLVMPASVEHPSLQSGVISLSVLVSSTPHCLQGIHMAKVVAICCHIAIRVSVCNATSTRSKLFLLASLITVGGTILIHVYFSEYCNHICLVPS